MQTPKAGFTAVATKTSDAGLAVALTSGRVARERVGAEAIAVADTRAARVLSGLSGRFAVGTAAVVTQW